jgi:hypothetical protein
MLARSSLRLAAQDVALSRRKQGFESPRERHDFNNLADRARRVSSWCPVSITGSKFFRSSALLYPLGSRGRDLFDAIVERSRGSRRRIDPPWQANKGQLRHHELLQRSDYESGGREFESLRARQKPFNCRHKWPRSKSAVQIRGSCTVSARNVADGSLACATIAEPRRHPGMSRIPRRTPRACVEREVVRQ